jgi:hypothetical protein
MALKHIGRDAKTNRKVIVAYRIVPGEPENCIVIKTESLDAASHDALITAVESNAGQTAYEFAEAMFRNTLPDGMNMLTGMQKYGKMVKVPTSSIEMTPDTKTSINLSELNKMIADQKGVTIAELALSDANGKTVEPKDSGPAVDPIETYSSEAVASEGVLTDEDLAAQYRSQADALYKEAKKLREQAEELVPTKKKTKSNAKETA